MSFETPEQKQYNDDLKSFIEYLAVVLGGGVPIKPVRLMNVPTAFYTVPQCVSPDTEQNYRDNVAELTRYAERCGLFKRTGS